MSDRDEIDAFELDRLDLFATQTLLKSLLFHVINSSDEPDKLAQSIAALYEESVHLFELRGAEGAKAQASRDYMLHVGIQILAESRRAAS